MVTDYDAIAKVIQVRTFTGVEVACVVCNNSVFCIHFRSALSVFYAGILLWGIIEIRVVT